MKLSNIKILTVASIFMATSACNSNAGKKVEQAADTVGQKVQNMVDSAKQNYQEYKAADFVKDAAKSNAKELHLIALAMQKATRKDIKDAAKHMKPDHEQMGDQVKTYAAKNNITIDVDSNDLMTNLDNDKPGKDWDKDWINKLTSAHKDLVDKFNDAQSKVTDPELKDIITKAIPVIQSHYDMLKGIQDKMNASK